MEEKRYKYTIYKICCDDCEEVYVGSTRAYARRKNQHKSDCNNSNSKCYNHLKYQTIRANGGWNNWRMVPIEELQNVSKREAEIKEEQWRVNLNSILNMKKSSRGEISVSDYQKEYKLLNANKIKENRTKRYLQNKDKIKTQQKTYSIQHKQQIADYKKQYYLEHKEQISAYKKDYYEKTKKKRNTNLEINN